MDTRRFRALGAVISLVLIFAPGAFAQSETNVPDDFQQFAFWVGKWSIRQDGAPGVATDSVKRLGNGIALLEKYRAPDGSTGTSVTVFDVQTGQWTQTWSDSGGGYIQITGGIQGDRVVLVGTSIAPDGGRQMIRVIFEKITKRSLDQLGEISNDGGATWQRIYTTHWTKQ